MLKLFTVRNLKGQLMGRFRASTADRAITAFLDSQNVQSSVFKRSMPMRLKREDFRATGE